MKRLVVCCDGTWSTPNQARCTNVVRFFDSVADRGPDGVLQRPHYVQGVGTAPWSRILGGVFGLGLSGNVQDAYRFLVDNFEEGDEVFLLGFSRGAYTARSVGGFIRNAGILRRENLDRLGEAYEIYRSGDGADSAEATRFRERYSRESRIRFVGVWDTVGALGIPGSSFNPITWFNRRWRFHDTELSSWVDAAFHAIAIDERRKSFEPTLWQPTTAPGQWVEQVWFAGVHSDVGGGYADDQRGLADIALVWMGERAAACGLGLTDGWSDPPRVAPRADGRLHDSRAGFFGLLPALVRQLGVEDPDHEYAASSAIERQDAEASYAPNLRTYRATPAFQELAVTTRTP